jgi:hypothetical protein
MKAVRVISALAIIFLALNTVWGQSTLPNSSSRPAMNGAFASGINLAPSNPLGMPVAYGGPAQGSAIVPFTSGMLGAYMPTIPNLELGFQYYFGNKVRSGQVSGDYLLPYNLGNDSVVFGEAHGNYWDFAQKPPGGASHRVDLSLGGGYRKIVSNQLLVGINGFYDTSRLFNNWYSSGSFGLEMAANMGSSDAVDLNANWYGDLFASNSILNAFRNQGSSYDVEAGYSHAMFDSALDLRVKAAGYQFNTGANVYGYKTGADLTTKDGMFTLRYEYGNDKINGSWNNIGAFVNVGFQMENIIKGESPFAAPEPIFKSPRNLRRMLTQKVRRDWNQQYAPGRAALASAAVGGYGSICRFIAIKPALQGFVDFDTVVPYADLDPGSYVTVSFTVNWSGGRNTIGIFPGVESGFFNNVNTTMNVTKNSSWSGIQLCGQQSDFGGLDPYRFSVGVAGAENPVLTDITVCFNQSGSCP